MPNYKVLIHRNIMVPQQFDIYAVDDREAEQITQSIIGKDTLAVDPKLQNLLNYTDATIESIWITSVEPVATTRYWVDNSPFKPFTSYREFWDGWSALVDEEAGGVIMYVQKGTIAEDELQRFVADQVYEDVDLRQTRTLPPKYGAFMRKA